MDLIVSEKNTAARRIADILSDSSPSKSNRHGVPVYSWNTTKCVGLSGHIVGVDFPEKYANWSAVSPADLVDADVVKTPAKQDHVNALQELAADADRVVIATDYDREGELIGKEAYELIREVNTDATIDRARFSSLTAPAVTAAFEDPDSIDFDLAAAGEARQTIDLIWGAALTRFLSLAANQYGDDFISVGRVQSPTLKLIVDREREIEAFDPKPYWELFADLDAPTADQEFEAQYYYLDVDDNEAERIWAETDATSIQSVLEGATTGNVTAVDRRTRTDRPPAPFNTTQFIRAASAVSVSAKRAMSIAEDLYTAGYITYPRTDNQTYPSGFDPVGLLERFADTRTFGGDARKLLNSDSISPTRGEQSTTDHPPIHPTAKIPNRGQVSKTAWRIYELVVRRFFATVADAAIWEHLRADIDINGLALKANGKRLTNPGYHAVYPYFNTTEEYVPDLTEGDQVDVVATRLEDHETQPPRRYGQSRLIETMEDLGIGTKATRHEVLDKLYNRGYIEGDPPTPTALARGVVDAAEAYAGQVVSESMTAQLEAEMTAIANGDKTLDDVTSESRSMLEDVFEDLEAAEAEIGELVQEAMKRDKTLGPCPDCGEALLVRENNSGQYFVGCDGYPACEFTLPLPTKGRPVLQDDVCTDHELKEVKMLAGKQTFVHGCPKCEAESAANQPDRVLGACPADGADHTGELAIKTLPSGSRLVGCTEYPDCEYSLPLPRRGDITILDDQCAEHGLPELEVDNGSEPWALGCPICNYRDYQAKQDGDSGLQSITGIGSKTAAKLVAAGIESPTDLQDVDPESLAAEITGVSASQLQDWQGQVDATAGSA